MSTVVPEPDKRPLDDLAIPQDGIRPGTFEESDAPLIIHVGAAAFVRTMWSLFWTAFRHPFSTTFIDAATGEVLDPFEEAI